MNQEQRKFLIERVTKTHSRQIEEVRKDLPRKPSLNNYLVAACLDDSIKLKDVKILKAKIREQVLKLGASEVLVSENSDDDYSYGRRNKRDRPYITVAVEDIFEIPRAYLDALAEYEAKKKEVNDKIKLLDSQKETIILKIQIGSNKVLDKLIEQADNLADLNIMNSQLLLTAGE